MEKITRAIFPSSKLDVEFYINLSLELRTFVTELSSPKNEPRGCTLFPQDEKRVRVLQRGYKTYRTLSRFEETRRHGYENPEGTCYFYAPTFPEILAHFHSLTFQGIRPIFIVVLFAYSPSDR